MTNNPRKRILLVIRYPVGGIKTYIKYIYSQNNFDEFDFTIITPEISTKAFFEKIFQNRNFEYISCENSWSMLTNTYRYLRNKDIDIIHSHGYTAGILTAILMTFTHIPHLMTAHDVFQKKQFIGFKGKLKKIMLSIFFKRIDKIHTVSHDATSDFLDYFPKTKQENIICIPHGIDTEAFFNSKPANIQLQHNKKNVCLIGFFGRFMAQKGFKYLVDAIEIIAQQNLTDKEPLVLTFDWGGFVREEYQMIEDRNLSKYFQIMEYTENMPGVIKAMDLVVMPSLWESSGLLGMESLVAGVPIIGTSCIGLREVLDKSPAEMVAPMDSVSLAKAIAKELNHPRKEKFKEYSLTAKDRYSLKRPSSKLKYVYDSLLSHQTENYQSQ